MSVGSSPANSDSHAVFQRITFSEPAKLEWGLDDSISANLYVSYFRSDNPNGPWTLDHTYVTQQDATVMSQEESRYWVVVNGSNSFYTDPTAVPSTTAIAHGTNSWKVRTATASTTLPVSTIGVNGTASFSGLISASTAPTADAHLTNKLYVDTLHETDSTNLTNEINTRTSQVAALQVTDASIQSQVDAERAAREAADAQLLQLTGGTMAGNIELGQIGTSLIQTQDFSAAVTGAFAKPIANAFDGIINQGLIYNAQTSGNYVEVTIPINPPVPVTESVTIYGETAYAEGTQNVSVTVDGVKTQANDVGKIHNVAS